MRRDPYKRYVLSVLTLTYTLSMTDQGLMSLLLQPIKESLHLSDNQLGFLVGIAFALFYSTLGIPFARWADRGNRTTITAIAIALWGTGVMSCLVVSNFTQLVAARVATSIGAAGCMAPTYSLIGDYFQTPKERTRAMTIYTLANTLAVALSTMAGGWLNALYGWRGAFFVIATPALLVAILVKLSVTEPRARGDRAIKPAERLPPIADVLGALWHGQTTRHLVIALIVVPIVGFGLAAWYAVFMIRMHGMDTASLGIWLGLIFGFGGAAGTALGGYVADRWFSEDERGQMRMIAVSIAAVVPCCALFLFLPGKVSALIALLFPIFAIMVFWGPTFAVLQRLVADDMRATAFALVMLFFNLIGMGVGPQLIGTLSDVLTPQLGGNSLRYAMLITSTLALWGAFHFWKSGQTIKQDLLAIERRQSFANVLGLTDGGAPHDGAAAKNTK